ncbi:mediator of RNA polymerase II transcription subunit 13 [Dimargaris verticillata]|uniref:Mediator of RNA polymerase II transcription subunit 13 n=1 Tax=Dimargaris verticillata TaxID=2761393 RepID=A0A9W8B4F1_9FUNG|nr:mediator of RNA polymerase II transcription subunit 13 [Dimargaris verticillata]
MLSTNSKTGILSLAGFGQVRWRCYSHTCKRSELVALIRTSTLPTDSTAPPQSFTAQGVPPTLAQDPLFKAYVLLLQHGILTYWRYRDDLSLTTQVDPGVFDPLASATRPTDTSTPNGPNFGTVSSFFDENDPDVRRELWVFMLCDENAHAMDAILGDLTEIQSGVLNWDNIPSALMNPKISRVVAPNPECKAFYHSVQNLLATSSLMGFSLAINPSSLQILLTPTFYALNLHLVTEQDISRRCKVILSPLGEEARIIGLPLALSDSAIQYMYHEWVQVYGLPPYSSLTVSDTHTIPLILELQLLSNRRRLYYPTALVFTLGNDDATIKADCLPNLSARRSDTSMPSPVDGTVPDIDAAYWSVADPFSQLVGEIDHLEQVLKPLLKPQNESSEGDALNSRPTLTNAELPWVLQNDILEQSMATTEGASILQTPPQQSVLSPQPLSMTGTKANGPALPNQPLAPSTGLPTAPTVDTTGSVVPTSRDATPAAQPPYEENGESSAVVTNGLPATDQPKLPVVDPSGNASASLDTAMDLEFDNKPEPNEADSLLMMDHSESMMISGGYDFEDLDQGLGVTEDDFSFFDEGPRRPPIPLATELAPMELPSTASTTTNPIETKPLPAFDTRSPTVTVVDAAVPKVTSPPSLMEMPATAASLDSGIALLSESQAPMVKSLAGQRPSPTSPALPTRFVKDQLVYTALQLEPPFSPLHFTTLPDPHPWLPDKVYSTLPAKPKRQVPNAVKHYRPYQCLEQSSPEPTKPLRAPSMMVYQRIAAVINHRQSYSALVRQTPGSWTTFRPHLYLPKPLLQSMAWHTAMPTRPWPPLCSSEGHLPSFVPEHHPLHALYQTTLSPSSSTSHSSSPLLPPSPQGPTATHSGSDPDADVGVTSEWSSKLNSLFEGSSDAESLPSQPQSPSAKANLNDILMTNAMPAKVKPTPDEIGELRFAPLKKRQRTHSDLESSPTPDHLGVAHGLYVALLSETPDSRTEYGTLAPLGPWSQLTNPTKPDGPLIAANPPPKSILAHLFSYGSSSRDLLATHGKSGGSAPANADAEQPAMNLDLRSPLAQYRESLSKDSFLEVIRIICHQAALGAFQRWDPLARQNAMAPLGISNGSGVAPEQSLVSPGALAPSTISGLTDGLNPVYSVLQPFQGVVPAIDLQRLLQTAWCQRLNCSNARQARNGGAPGAKLSHPIYFKGPLSLNQLTEISEQSQYAAKYSKFFIKKRRTQESELEKLAEPEIVVGFQHTAALPASASSNRPAERTTLQLQTTATVLSVWEKMQLMPFSHAKDVTYFALVPSQTSSCRQEYLGRAVAWYLDTLSEVYEACRLGHHRAGHLDGLSPGLVPVVDPLASQTDLLAQTSASDQRLRSYMLTCERLGVALRSRYPPTESRSHVDPEDAPSSHLVIYLVNPTPTTPFVFELCNCIRMLQSMWRGNRKHNATDTQLVFQILDPAAITSAFSVGRRTHDVRNLAFSVYAKCYRPWHTLWPPISDASSAPLEEYGGLWNRLFAPPMALVRPLPTQLNFTLNTDVLNAVSPVDSDTTVHVMYALSVSRQWVICVWADYRGQFIDTAIYDNETAVSLPATTAVAQAVLSQIWQKSRALEHALGLPLKFTIARLGSFTEAEWLTWDGLLADHQRTSLISVFPNSTFYAVPDPLAEPSASTDERGSGKSHKPGASPVTPWATRTKVDTTGSPKPSPYGSPLPASLDRSSSGLRGSTTGTSSGNGAVAATDGCETLVSNRGPVQLYVFNHRQPMPHLPDLTLSPPPQLFSLATGYLIQHLEAPDLVADAYTHGSLDAGSTTQLCIEVRLIRPSATQSAVATLREALHQYHGLMTLNHWTLFATGADATTATGLPDSSAVLTNSVANQPSTSLLSDTHELVPTAFWRFLPLPLAMLQRVVRVFVSLETPRSIPRA